MLEILKGRAMWAFALLIVLLVICNVSFAFSGGWSRLGWQLFSFGGLFAVYKLAGLTLADIGLSRDKIGAGFKFALITMAIILAVFLVVFLVNKNVFADRRYSQSWVAALVAALIYLPLKTVIFEELAFRGLMPAILKDMGASIWVILIVSSILFGLWHILTAPTGSVLSVGNFSNLAVVGGVIVITSVAGAALLLLRHYSDSLIAPIAVHWFVNGTSIVLASLSWLGNK